MNGALVVRAAGAYASIQDRGRSGFRRIGVPCSGALDPALLAIANALVGNPAGHPAIECFDGGQRFTATQAPMRVAVAGAAAIEIGGDGGWRKAAAWRSHLLAPGECLRITRLEAGRIAMVAVAGLAIDAVLHSASTYARAGFGGWHGRALAAGDTLPGEAASVAPERYLATPWEHADSPIRVVLGPQQAHFTAAACETLLNQPYTVSAAADRMGIRLEGAALAHHPALGQEIVSDAIVPGAIQVPGNGLPIVLLADAQTAGGYPKIATVISADLARLAAKRPGDTLRFRAVAAHEGEAAARAAAALLGECIRTIRVIAEVGVDIDALYCGNLVSGVVSAISPEHIPLYQNRET